MNLRMRRSGTFAETRVGLVKSSHLIVGVLVSACVALSLVWFFLVSGYWSVQTVQTNNLSQLSREEVASTTFSVIDQGGWKPWNRRTIFFIDKQELAVQLRDKLFADSVIVDKVYPNVLRLMISERQRSVVVASKDQLLLVDTNGVVTGDASDAVVTTSHALLANAAFAGPKDFPVMNCELPELAAVGYQVTTSDTVKAWINAYKAFIGSGIKFRYLKLTDPSSHEVHLVTDQGFEAIFDLGSDLGPQIDTYKKFLESKPKNLVVHEYADVRIPGKIFYK
jgi:hypothetical protein